MGRVNVILALSSAFNEKFRLPQVFYIRKEDKTMTVDTRRSAAVTRAVSRYSADLVRLAYSYLLCRADAQDAVQDAFMSYLKHAPEFENEDKEKAWLMKVTANRCRNVLRSPWFKNRAPIPEDLPADGDSREVILALGKLAKKYRMCVHLHYYEGYSINEIAQMLGAKPATVGTWLSRAREQLKQELGGEL